MRYLGRRDIFICESVEIFKEIYNFIWDYICDEVSCEYCRLIDEDELLHKLGQGKAKEIRFACLTDETLPIITEQLYLHGVPIIMINIGSINNLKKVFVIMERVEEDQFNRMVYSIDSDDSPAKIQGALNWVHTYYYSIRDQALEEVKRKAENEKMKMASRILEKELSMLRS